MAIVSGRPDFIEERIEERYQELASRDSADWTVYSGREKYRICGLDDHELCKSLLGRVDSLQKNFYILDVGAGHFQWGRALYDFINGMEEFPRGMRVHIINVRGEPYLGARKVEAKRSVLYNIGAFKIEQMREELIRVGFAGVSLDFVSTRWAIRHLVDPVGTIKDIYNLLRPKTGLFLLDGCYASKPGEDLKRVDMCGRMVQLFIQARVDFLAWKFREDQSVDHFMLQRLDEREFRMDMTYEGLTELLEPRGGFGGIGSCAVVRFEGWREKRCLSIVELPKVFYGNRVLYDWLRSQRLVTSDIGWAPLRKKDRFPLHRAILTSKEDLAASYIDSKADLSLLDDGRQSAIHLAVVNHRLVLLKKMIDAKTSLEILNGMGQSPLDLAISLENVRAISMLIEANVAVNHLQVAKLIQMKLTHLLQLRPKPEEAKVVSDSIKKRNRVWG